MAGKRKNGEGTWGEKTIKGVKYQYYRDSNLKYTYAKTLKELKIKLKEKKEKKDNTIVSSSSTLIECANIWLETKKISLAERTYFDYKEIIKNRLNINGFNLGDRKIQTINLEMLQDHINRMSELYSLATIQKAYVVIKCVIKYAMENNYMNVIFLNRLNMPIEDNVKIKKKEIAFATIEDVEYIYNEAKRKNTHSCYSGKIGDNFYGNNAYIIILIAYTGLRLSEACGLKWKMVNLKKKEITIKNALSEINGEKKLKSTKRKSSIRTIPLPARAIEVIKYFKKFNPNYTEDDFVCLNKQMKPISKRNVERTLQQILTRCKANNNITPHSLRHGYGSILLANNVDIIIISKLLGHSSVKTTYDIYIGITDSQKHTAINNTFKI